MVNLNTEEVARGIQRKLGLVVFPATLGDSAGVVYDDPAARNGMVRVRYTTAAGLSLPPVVRMKATLPPNPGTSVLVGYDKQGELAVLEGDYTGMLAQGLNPLVMNAADPNVYGYTNQSGIVTALCHAISTPNVSSTEVVVKPLFYLVDDVWYLFTGVRVELSSFIPAAGLHCVVGLYLKTDQTIETFASTDQDLLDPLVHLTVLQEIHNQITAGSIPIWFWRLYGGQTAVKDSDSFLDGRQFINTVMATSATGGTLIDANTYIVDDGDVTKRIQFQVSPVTAGQTRVITVKDVNLTMVGEDTVQAISGKTSVGIRDDAAQPSVTVENQSSTSTRYPLLNFRRARSSGADLSAGDRIGWLSYWGMVASAYAELARIQTDYLSPTSDQATAIIVSVSDNIALTEYFRLSGVSKEVIVNEDGLNDVDFRVETDNLSRALFVDASADGVGINQSSIAATAILDIASTTKGLLIPRMTTAQRDAIGTPADGLLVYDTDVDALSQYQNGAWNYYVNLSGTQTLTNKSISASQINSGTLPHERGGLEEDVSAYAGLIGITGGATEQVAMPQRASLPMLEITLTAGTYTITHTTNTSQPFNYMTKQATAAEAADGDAFSLSFWLKAGTYTMSVLGQHETNNGKIDWKIDGSTVVSGQDWYAAATANGIIKTASVAVATDGYHKLEGVINGKNASSSDFLFRLTHIWFKPASD